MAKVHFPLCVKKRWRAPVSRGCHLVVFTRYSFLAAITLFLWLSTLSAQTVGKLGGTVTEARNDEPLPGANIEIVGMMMGAAADENGEYYILNIPPGKYELRASMVGFKSMKVINVIVNSGKTTRIDFKLEEEILEAEEVVVIAERPDVERDKTSTSAVVRFEEVENCLGYALNAIGNAVQPEEIREHVNAIREFLTERNAQ